MRALSPYIASRNVIVRHSGGGTRNVRAAILVSVIGTTVLLILSWATHGLVGTPWDLASCALGAFVSTWLVNRRVRIGFRANLPAATIIVFATFLCISAGHAASQILDAHAAVDFEPVGKFVWATLATSWWLVPLCAMTLAYLNRRTGAVGVSGN
jgi:hypothetical protein